MKRHALYTSILSYDDFTFDAATGVYEGKIDKTIKKTVLGVEVEYHYTGTAELSFSDGKILSMEYNMTTTMTDADGILDGDESVFTFMQFTAGGRAFRCPTRTPNPRRKPRK